MNLSTHEAIDNFFENHPVQKYRRGQVLILPGEGTDYAYYLVRGRMKVYDISYRGDEITIDIFKEPAIFPLSLILNQSSTRYIYEADSDIELRRAPATEMLDFLGANAEMTLDLLSHLYDRLDDVIDRMVHLVARSAKSRIVHELIVMCGQLGDARIGGGYSLSMTEKELGAKIGLSRETVSREMRSLKEKGLLQISHKHIIVSNLNRLQAYEQQHH
jgi:CRP-like cAMP-binding protein